MTGHPYMNEIQKFETQSLPSHVRGKAVGIVRIHNDIKFLRGGGVVPFPLKYSPRALTPNSQPSPRMGRRRFNDGSIEDTNKDSSGSIYLEPTRADSEPPESVQKQPNLHPSISWAAKCRGPRPSVPIPNTPE